VSTPRWDLLVLGCTAVTFTLFFRHVSGPGLARTRSDSVFEERVQHVGNSRRKDPKSIIGSFEHRVLLEYFHRLH
jgi:hypothetical protein